MLKATGLLARQPSGRNARLCQGRGGLLRLENLLEIRREGRQVGSDGRKIFYFI